MKDSLTPVTSMEKESDLKEISSVSPRSVLTDSDATISDPMGMSAWVEHCNKRKGEKKRLDMMATCFSNTVCIGEGAASAANCNDETLSPSFLILEGFQIISLGMASKKGKLGESVLKEAIDRWSNRVETRIYVGNVSYEYRQAEEKLVFPLGGQNRALFDDKMVGAAAKLVRAGSIVSQTLVKELMPRSVFDCDGEDSRIMNTDRYIPPAHSMAANHLKHQEFNSALKLFADILRGDREKYGENDLVVAMDLHNKAVAHLLAGEKDEALYNFHEAVLCKKSALRSEDSPHIADSLTEVGFLLYACGELERALAIFHEALDMYGQDFFSEEDIGASQVLNNIGCVHFDMGNTETALSFLQKALAIQRISLSSSQHAESALLNLSLTETNIGYIKLAQSSEDAIAMFEEALLVQQSVLGDENETVRNTVENISLCKSMGLDK